MKLTNSKRKQPRKSQVSSDNSVNSRRPNLWKKVLAFGIFAVIPVLFTQKAVFAEGEGFTIAETSGSTAVDESGTSDIFTIVLDVQPASDVTFSISDGSSDETSISPTTVTFTNSNWDTAQTVTVTGSDDNIIDGSQTSTITISVVDEISDNAYDSVADQTLSVTTTDDDAAGFTIAETLGASEVDETGTTDNISVVLNAEPTSDVVISVTSSDTGEVTSSPATLTFTAANWSIAQTVTLTGANDDLVDGSQTSTVTLSVVDGSSDDDFDGITDQTVSVTTTDSDVAGFTVIESGGTTTVAEDGTTTDDFTVVLDAQPISDVVISVTSLDTGEVTVSPATLTFTSGNWDSSQTVTVTGVDDSLIDGSQTSTVTIAVVDESSNDSFDSLADQTVSVSTADNDTAGFTITQTDGSSSVTEGGSTDLFTVVLDAQPTSDVVITVSSSDTGEATVSDSTLTFTAANWDTAQTITMTGVDDDLIDGTQTSTITLAVDDANSDDSFDAASDGTVSVSTADDDTAGFTITQTDGSSSVTEGGSTDLFTVVLDKGPLTDVVITVSSSDTGEATVSSSTLTFTAANWDTAQTITMTGVDDDLVDGTQTSTITLSVVDAISNDDFDGVADQTVSVSTTDDDTAGFTVTQTGGSSTVTEGGSTDQITVVLDAQPTSNVVIAIVSADTGEATVSNSTLTFTAANWDTPQTITITGVDDDQVDGNQSTNIAISVVDASSDNEFDGIADQNVSIETTDDDSVGFTVVETSGSTIVGEDGSTDTFSIVLNVQPSSDVVFTITSSDEGEATVTGSLTFTSANWDTAQNVTVTGVDDNPIDGDQTSTLTISILDIVSDDDFDAVADRTLSVTTTDDDVAGFTIAETGGSTSVDESGNTDIFTVVLNAQPSSNVVLDISSSDTGEATVTSPLTFTSANWDTPQNVTVTGVDDDIVDGSVTSTITVTVNDGSSDNNFDAVSDQTVSVTTTDDDVAGFTIAETGGSTGVDESGNTDTFTVVLNKAPLSDVVFAISSSDEGEATVTGSLTFTSANWDTAQTVTVTGADDSAIDGTVTSTITVAINDGTSDNAFDSVTDQTVSVSTADDDVAGFTIAETGGSTGVDESGNTDTFTVVLNAQPTTDVVFAIVSADTGEATVSNSTLTFTAANWDTPQTITITGVDDDIIDASQVSTSTISIIGAISDDNFDSVADQTVSVTTADDDVAGFTITETGGSTGVSESGTTDLITVVLNAQPNSDVVLQLTSADTGELTTTSTVTFTSANWDTAQTVTVTGVDDDLIDGTETTIVTLAVLDAASDNNFDAVSDQTVSVTTTDDDVAGFTIAETGGSTGVDESGNTDTFTVVLNAQPTTDVVLSISSADTGEATATSSLTFTTANWNAPKTVTITGVDDDIIDGTQTSTITVSVIDGISDDAFDSVADQTVSVTTTDDDVAGFTVTETGGSTGVSESGTTDLFSIVLNTQPDSDVVLSITSSDTDEATVDSLIQFTSANWDTPQNVTVTGVDDGIIDGTQTSTITITVVDAITDDEFDDVADQTVSVTTADDDVAGFTIAETGGSTGVDESGNTDVFTVVLNAEPSSNVVLDISSSDTGEATVTSPLTFTSANWDTPQNVTVTGIDDDLIDGTISSTITVTVNDGSSDDNFDAVSDQTVSVTTTDDDVAGFTIAETGGSTGVDESGNTDTFTVVLNAQPTTDVVIQFVSADTGEVTVTSLLTFTSANWDTAQTVTVTGVDEDFVDQDQTTTVTASILDVSSDDNFDAVADQTVSVTTTDDDAAGFTIAETGGSTEVTEAGSTDLFTVVLTGRPITDVVFSITSSDSTETSVSSSLTFTSENWDTPQSVTVTGLDDDIIDGTQTSILTIAIDDANSDNSFDPINDQTVTATNNDDDVAGFTITETEGSTSVDESENTDTFNIVLDAQPQSDVVLTITSSDTGEATVTSLVTFTSANWDTAQIVTVTGVDDDIIDGTQTSTITISVNDASSDDAFDSLTDQTISANVADNDSSGFTIAETGGSTGVDESGDTDTFSVVLNAQPLSDVVFTIASSDTGEVTSTSTLTFTSANWNNPQNVTVTGVDDDLVDGTQTTNVTVSINDASSDDDFDAVADQTVTVSTTDDDVAGFTVTETGGSTGVTEAGGTDTFNVVLNAQPSTDVLLSISSSDAGEATVTSSLTFTSANWDTAQTVTVTGVDDSFIDGTVNSTVTISIVEASSDDSFDSLSDQTVTVSTTDDDVAGFTVTETEGSTSVTENGGTDTFNVVLDAQPSSNVVLSISSSDTGEATVTSLITFTSANWDTAQTVTVTGVDDNLVDGTQNSTISISVVDVISDDTFDAVASQTLSASITDDDIAGFTIVELEGSTAVDESGTTDTFTVVLNAQPSSDVALTITSSDTGEATVTSLITFTSANWDTAQTVTVTGVDDDLIDGTTSSTLTVAVLDSISDDDFDAVADQTVSVSTTDDDAAGFTVTETAGSTSVTEAGTTDTFTIVLNAEPVSDVVLDIVSSDTGEATVTSTLTFTSANWDTAQTVTVTGADDDLIDGTVSSTITVSVNDASSDNNFDAVADQTVTASTTDDDVAGFTVTETEGSTSVTEAGGTDTFTVVLNAQPSSNVVLSIASSDTGEATVTSTLTFTSANWDTAQTVTVTGADDDLVDGTVSSITTVSVIDAASDDNFDAVADQTVSVLTTDDDAAGFTVTETGGSTGVDESGTTDTFTVVLNAQPDSDVVLSITSSDTGE
ncbi:MAG: hypothetical protein CL465_05685, partial [Acidimicrobiaceae bacterium]|nr:hypothetical protein [Acidimicrobiaceae bacterium]